MHDSSSTGRIRAYTLIEMLIVLGIIMVLAGIMIPASLAAYRRARLSQAVSLVQGALEDARTRSSASGERYAVLFCNADCRIDTNGDGSLSAMDTRHWLSVVRLAPGTSQPQLEDIDSAADRVYLPDGVVFKALSYQDAATNSWDNGWSDSYAPVLSDGSDVDGNGLSMIIYNPVDPEGLVTFYGKGSARSFGSSIPDQQYISMQLEGDNDTYLLLKIKEKSGVVSTVVE